MKTSIFSKNPFLILLRAALPMLFTFTVMACMLYGFYITEQSGRAESLRLLQEGITRAAVACYAAEGRYPESLEYIEEHYGVRIDHSRYKVYYNVYASNILPEITVLELRD